MGFNVFGLSIGRQDSQIDSLKKEIFTLKAAVIDSQTTRPLLEFSRAIGADGVRIPYAPIDFKHLYDLAIYSDTLRTVIQARVNEAFRRGFLVEKKFEGKCPTCGFEADSAVAECPTCHVPLTQPDEQQERRWETWSRRVNENGQNIKDVLKAGDWDLNVVDDAYWLWVKEYTFINGDIVSFEVREFIRASPIDMRLIADNTGRPGRDETGTRVLTCPIHRNKMFREGAQLDNRCPICQRVMKTAVAVARGKGGNDIYYIEGELIHTSEFSPSLTTGTSPIFSVWQKAITLLEQDRYQKDLYTKGRPPIGMMLFNTPNADGLKKSFQAGMEIYKTNPHIPLLLAMHSEGGGKLAEFFDFMRSLEEMQFTQVRDEFRRTIGAVYGVLPLFLGEGVGGGLNNEGLQITVTNRAIEMAQEVYNTNVLPKICETLGITDYTVMLRPVEAMNEKTELEIEAAKIANAQAMKNLGFDVKRDEQTGEFTFTPAPPRLPAQGDVSPAGFTSDGSLPAEGPTMTLDDGAGSFPREQVTRLGAPFSSSPVASQPTDNRQRFGGEPEMPTKSDEGFPFRDVDEHIFKDGFLAAFNAQLERTRVELKKAELPGTPDEVREVLDALSGSLYSRKFEGMSKSISDRIKDVILEQSVKNKTPEQILTQIRKVNPRMDEAQAETIVRTELGSVLNAFRELSYRTFDPEQKEKYKWIGPMDHRTSEICKAIHARTAKGVPLVELKRIIKEESEKAGIEPRELQPHPNCRHTFVRAV